MIAFAPVSKDARFTVILMDYVTLETVLRKMSG